MFVNHLLSKLEYCPDGWHGLQYNSEIRPVRDCYGLILIEKHYAGKPLARVLRKFCETLSRKTAWPGIDLISLT